MKPDYSIMHHKTMAESLGVPATATATITTNTLTPTTLRNITQIFESEDCLNNLQTYDVTGGFETPTIVLTTTTDAVQQQQPATDILNLVPMPVTTAADPPLIVARTSYANLDSKCWQGGLTTVVTPSKCVPMLGSNSNSDEEEDYKDDDDKDEDYEPEMKRTAVTRSNSRRSARITATKSSPATSARAPKRKSNKGGRKPAGKTESHLPPAEAKRLNVRRERNKEAAARCRKRRLDLTNKLLNEVDLWESKRRQLEEEITLLKGQRNDLQFILEAHNGQPCKLAGSNVGQQQQQATLVVAVKSEPTAPFVIVEPANAPYVLPEEIDSMPAPPKRPVSLSLSVSKAVSPKVEGVDIETPSSIIPTLCFDGTGLTPTTVYTSAPTLVTPIFTPTLNTPTCSSQHQQQRASEDGISAGPDYLLL